MLRRQTISDAPDSSHCAYSSVYDAQADRQCLIELRHWSYRIPKCHADHVDVGIWIAVGLGVLVLAVAT
jgi:hypothetical protein